MSRVSIYTAIDKNDIAVVNHILDSYFIKSRYDDFGIGRRFGDIGDGTMLIEALRNGGYYDIRYDVIYTSNNEPVNISDSFISDDSIGLSNEDFLSEIDNMEKQIRLWRGQDVWHM